MHKVMVVFVINMEQYHAMLLNGATGESMFKMGSMSQYKKGYMHWKTFMKQKTQ